MFNFFFVEADLWKNLFETTLLTCIKDSYHAIRATICNILGNIPVSVFDALTVLFLRIA